MKVYVLETAKGNKHSFNLQTNIVICESCCDSGILAKCINAYVNLQLIQFTVPAGCSGAGGSGVTEAEEYFIQLYFMCNWRNPRCAGLV